MSCNVWKRPKEQEAPDIEKIGSAWAHLWAFTYLTPSLSPARPRVPDSAASHFCLGPSTSYPCRVFKRRRFTRRWAARGLGYCQNRTPEQTRSMVPSRGSKRDCRPQGRPAVLARGAVRPDDELDEFGYFPALAGIGNNHSIRRFWPTSVPSRHAQPSPATTRRPDCILRGRRRAEQLAIVIKSLAKDVSAFGRVSAGDSRLPRSPTTSPPATR